MQRIEHWVDGQLLSGADEGYDPVYDPATGEQTGEVALGGARQVDEAVSAARGAFPGWQDTSLARRTRVLFAFQDLVYRRREDLARAITAEHGKTFDDARGEVQRALEVIEFACGAPHLLKGGYSDGVSTNVDAHSILQPLGVAAGISPFNFPVMVPMWMHPLAIACGNAFVLKPSEKDPSPSLMVAQMWAEAGLPAGVFNVVQGGKAAVDAILDHGAIASVSFVGSTPIAKYVYERGTASGKRVQALGGAKNHMVVLPDADVDVAADAAVSAGYGSAGERCMAISAVVAVGSVGDALVEAMRQRTLKVSTGAGGDEGVEMGPLVTQAHLDRVTAYVEAGLAAGAKLVVDGRDCHVPGHEKGFFLGPCLFDEVTPDMTIYTDEIFGPVLSVLRVDDYDQALGLVNSNRYGNGVALFTNDGLAARRFEREVQVGMVGINVPIPTPMAYYSFGGWKQSMFGDTHMYGTHGVHFYTRAKAVTVRWPEPGAERALSLGFPTAH